MKRLTLAQVQAMPVIHVGHADNLIMETNTVCVWHSRLTTEDGAEYNDQITVEMMNGGYWATVDVYRAI